MNLYFPYLLNVFGELCSNLRLVNSDEYAWLCTTSNEAHCQMKPDMFSAFHGLIEYKKPYKGAPDPSNKLYGKFRPWHCRESIHCIWDCKWNINAAFGEKCKYLQVTGQGDVTDFNGRSLRLKGVLFDVTGFWMIKSVKNEIVQVMTCDWSQKGSYEHLLKFLRFSDFWKDGALALAASYDRQICDLSCQDDMLYPACLGAGGNGRVFLLDSGMVLKVVIGRKADDVEKEFRQMLHCLQACPDAVFPVVEDSYKQIEMDDSIKCAGYLLQCQGRKINNAEMNQGTIKLVLSSLFALHAKNLIHGDARLENILVHDGKALWIDFRVATLVSSEHGRQLDVYSLYESVTRKHVDNVLSSAIIAYAKNPSLDALSSIFESG